METIKATELRIGNHVLISLKSGQGRKVESEIIIYDLVKIQGGVGSFNYEPIELTEEKLLKFGFEKYRNPNNSDSWIYRKGSIKILFSKYGYELRDFNEFHVYIKYIHQLQNLYFALTGEELQISNPDQA